MKKIILGLMLLCSFSLAIDMESLVYKFLDKTISELGAERAVKSINVINAIFKKEKFTNEQKGDVMLCAKSVVDDDGYDEIFCNTESFTTFFEYIESADVEFRADIMYTLYVMADLSLKELKKRY